MNLGYANISKEDLDYYTKVGAFKTPGHSSDFNICAHKKKELFLMAR